ncbi:hypothetical protein CB0940_01612 [Cercospora beticola]|uniref:Uncharacterized protein n=1 Tax=Cercospora beticola TaxID=122368 RepID=A0A2G5I861_CERBT|nr:hypothetical protein CB0940_01612 [Cercospora beticola]PIB00960.1 hypothetical protein CB0940_01612 [Cercospora beticola]WPA97053.1 hypothetical protein RHO25_001661 [Cercospora beticola]
MFGINEEEAYVRAKQNTGLDVELLCSKLEAYKREQDIVQIRRGKRDALRSGRFMPKVAAKQFTATATPLRQDSVRDKHTSPRRESTSEPVTRRGPLDQDRRYTAMSFGVHDNRAIAAIVEERMGGKGMEIRRRDETSRDLSVKQHEPVGSAPRKTKSVTAQPLRHSLIQRTELWSKPLIPRRHSSRNIGAQSDQSVLDPNERDASEPIETKESCTGIYRPGDAAKRRTMPEDNKTIFSHDHFTNDTLQDTLLYHSLDHYSKPPLPVLEESERGSQDIQRPKLLPHDRPDWCQRSQNESSSHLLHIFSRSQKKGDDAYAGKRHSELPVRGLSEAPKRPVVENGHLIADAVKIIKDQERLRKRQSVVDFFRKF